VSARDSVATAADVTAPSQMEQSAEVGGGRSQLVRTSIVGAVARFGWAKHKCHAEAGEFRVANRAHVLGRLGSAVGAVSAFLGFSTRAAVCVAGGTRRESSRCLPTAALDSFHALGVANAWPGE